MNNIEDIPDSFDIDDTFSVKVKLPKEFREEWLKDLRSGKYGQTEGKLADGKGNYCCLGVACKTAGYSDYYLRPVDPDTGTAKTVEGDLLFFNSFIGKSNGGFDLKKIPDILKGENKFASGLASFNDGLYSFEDIADFIERNTVGV